MEKIVENYWYKYINDKTIETKTRVREYEFISITVLRFKFEYTLSSIQINYTEPCNR